MIHTRGGGGGLGYNDQHKLKIWTIQDLKYSEKGGLKDLNRVIDAHCQAWVLNCKKSSLIHQIIDINLQSWLDYGP